MVQYNSLVPLGKMAITAAGTTTPLSVNCGPYGGGINYVPGMIPVPGNAWRYMEIQADAANNGNLYLLPRGKTASANPEAIMVKIPIGASVPLPTGIMSGVGFLPENFVLDTDAVSGTQYAYGFGSLG